MHILLYEDILVNYLNYKEESNDPESMVKAILENKNSIFLFSKRLLSFLEGKVSKELYQRFLTKLNNLREKKLAVNYASTEETSSFEEEFIRLYNIHKSNVLITIAFEKPSESIQQATNNKIAVLSQQQKPNYHWLVINLAILHPFTLSVDEIDFRDDAETDKFFDDLFSIPRKISTIIIFDDYYNVDSHNKYAKVANRKDILVFYCTENHYRFAKYPKPDWNNNFNDDKYKILKKTFSKLELWTKNRGSHTRRIIFEGFIVNPDIDLDFLNKKNNKMWSVHIRFNEHRAKEITNIIDIDYKKYSK
ncbi:hypothetical protein [Hugenholtzia roseola]|uniref:hypothetical protein n=1 Tax=Hugenholtzia roseola TaxID=1002 RepID=UPI0004066F30|nr:hypothetical protein [Hugenholtzia roseola]